MLHHKTVNPEIRNPSRTRKAPYIQKFSSILNNPQIKVKYHSRKQNIQNLKTEKITNQIVWHVEKMVPAANGEKHK